MRKFWEQLAIATNWPVLAAVLVLSITGVISIWGDDPTDGKKQFLFLFIGLGCMIAFQAINYLYLGRFAWGFYIIANILVLYTVTGTCNVEGEACTVCPHVPVFKHLPQFVKHYQRQRVYAMFSDDPAILQGVGYQQHHAEIAFGSGGLTGKGLGNIPVGRFVPEAH